MTVLFIVMEFVPVNVAGVYRPLKFINGLKKAGLDPVVISIATDDNLKKIHKHTDPKLNTLLHPDIKIIRIPMDDITEFYSSRWKQFVNIYFNATDNFLKAWKKNFYEKLPQVINEYKPMAVITTCPPFSSAVLGRDVSRKYKLPYILDMRDAWAQLSMQPVGSYFHYLKKKWLERSCFKQADLVITVTPQLKQIFRSTHPSLPADKFRVVYNSLNKKLSAFHAVAAAPIGAGAIHIGYTGSYYYNPEARDNMLKPWWKKRAHRILQYLPVKEDWLYRSPYFFFRAMSTLLRDNPAWRSKLFFHHIGEAPQWLVDMVDGSGLKDNVVLHGFLPYADAQELQQGFDYLLATSEKVIGNDHYCLPSKLFNYIDSEKPVLGFVTTGVQKEFIEASGIGITFNPDDATGSAQKLANVLQEGISSPVNTAYLQGFHEDNTVSQFTGLVRSIVE